MRALFQDLHRSDHGVTCVEYALIAGLISLVVIGVVAGVGGKIKGVFSAINTSLASA